MGDQEIFAVIGLGYVGLPVALAFAGKFGNVIGFDIDARRIEQLRRGYDIRGEVDGARIVDSSLRLTSDARDLCGTTFYIVAVPTPIDAHHQPDLRALASACDIIGPTLRKGAVVVFESTVYPGLTSAFCGPRLEAASGLERGRDFKLGYSPERINPGDRAHTIDRIVKIVAGEDRQALDRIAACYAAVVSAGIHRAPSIEVAEAAKVIENTQRDLNIALMNEIAMICDRLGIVTRDVLAAAGTKWNFLPFTPGLVGGHCIGVDPYYLTARAEALGYHPQVILAGRRINDSMGTYIAAKLVKMLINADRPVRNAAVGILGLTYKENIRDLRNSRVADIILELKQFGITPLVHDWRAESDEVAREYGLQLSRWERLADLDGLILAVPHQEYMSDPARLFACLREGGVFIDVKSAMAGSTLPSGIAYWSL